MQTILERWRITAEELTQIVRENPSMRGLMLGYISEFKLGKLWFEGDAQITNLEKYDNHNRQKKGDLAFVYKGEQITVECKSLQSNTIRRIGEVYAARFQCDASDRRDVLLPTGERLSTTCLLVGQFDLLAVNLFEFEQAWRFVFAKNEDLPRSQYSRYTEQHRGYLLASTMLVTWPPQLPFRDEPFSLLDEIVHARAQARGSLRS